MNLDNFSLTGYGFDSYGRFTLNGNIEGKF